jgi:hypothetical protein
MPQEMAVCSIILCIYLGGSKTIFDILGERPFGLVILKDLSQEKGLQRSVSEDRLLSGFE